MSPSIKGNVPLDVGRDVLIRGATAQSDHPRGPVKVILMTGVKLFCIAALIVEEVVLFMLQAMVKMSWVRC